MTKSELNNRYFNWMYQLISGKEYTKGRSYRKLLRQLHETEFTYDIPMDGNRAEDGIDLRYRFGYDMGYEQNLIASYLDNNPCSVLEMLVALVVRCEEHIMSDPDIGDRTGKWFWAMMSSLGLISMYDSNYDDEYVAFVIGRLLSHEYGRDGEGGLFTIPGINRDMRSMEIWYQLCWYLNSIGE